MFGGQLCYECSCCRRYARTAVPVAIFVICEWNLYRYYRCNLNCVYRDRINLYDIFPCFGLVDRNRMRNCNLHCGCGYGSC